MDLHPQSPLQHTNFSPVRPAPTDAPSTAETLQILRRHRDFENLQGTVETIAFRTDGAEPKADTAAPPQHPPRDPPAETHISQPAPPPAAPKEAPSSGPQKRGRELDAEEAPKRRAAAKPQPKALVRAPPVEVPPAATLRRPITGPAAPTTEVMMEEATPACADGVGVDATPAAEGQPEQGAAVVTPEATSAPETAPATEATTEAAPATAPAFSLAERAPQSPAELASYFPAEGDKVEIIWQKDTTLEVDGVGDRCIVASLRGPFPDKKKRRRTTTLPAYHVYAELRSLVRLAGDQPGAFKRVDEADRRPKHVHPKYKLSLHARGTVWRRVDVED